VIVKHKRIFLIVVSLAVIVGLVTALTLPNKYSVISTIGIGQTIQNDKAILLESPETVKAKLENALVPLLLEQYDDEGIRTAKFVISIPKNSDLVILENKVKEDEIALFSQIHNKLITTLGLHHERLLKPFNKGIKAAIEKNKLELSNLQDERFFAPEQKSAESNLKIAESDLAMLENPVIQEYKLKTIGVDLENEKSKLDALNVEEGALKAKKVQLSKLSDRLVSQIKELEDHIKAMLSKQQRSMTEAIDEPQAMILLMIDKELQQNRNRLTKLEERLYVGLENQHSELLREISDIKRQQIHQVAVIEEKQKFLEKYQVENKLEQEKQKLIITRIKAELSKLSLEREQEIALKNQEISVLNTELGNIINTKAVSYPMRSQKPTGLSKELIVVLAIMLGMTLGLFGVFVAEIQSRARSRQLEG